MTEPFKPVKDALLPPGMYMTEMFQPTLIYTVSAGWTMYDDVPGQFEIALEHHDPYIYIWRALRAIAPDCADVPQYSVRCIAYDEPPGTRKARSGVPEAGTQLEVITIPA